MRTVTPVEGGVRKVTPVDATYSNFLAPVVEKDAQMCWQGQNKYIFIQIYVIFRGNICLLVLPAYHKLQYHIYIENTRTGCTPVGAVKEQQFHIQVHLSPPA